MKRADIIAAFAGASPTVRDIVVRWLAQRGDRYDIAQRIDAEAAAAIIAEADDDARDRISKGARVRASRFRFASAECVAEMIAYDTARLAREHAGVPSVLGLLLDERRSATYETE